MIDNIGHFKQTAELIQGMGRVLESLAEDSSTMDPGLFAVMAEGYIAQIQDLSRQLDDFVCQLTESIGRPEEVIAA